MPETPAFENLLALVEDRSAALRTSVADSPDLDVRVPSCPDWSLRDLVEHLTEVQRFWAAAVTASPSEHPPTLAPASDALPADLLTRSATATQELIAALRAAGPAMGCWTWWGACDVPMTSGAVARHQVQEAAVHAFDAQLAAGLPQPVPAIVALDGIAEFIAISHGTAGPWPYELGLDWPPRRRGRVVAARPEGAGIRRPQRPARDGRRPARTGEQPAAHPAWPTSPGRPAKPG